MAHALISSARKLLAGQPGLWDLRRCVSSAYYALFHFLCQKCSDHFVSTDSVKFARARRQAYLSLDHGAVKAACIEARDPARGFPKGIVRFAMTFGQLQARRHEADYDPETLLTLAMASDLIEEAVQAMSSFEAGDQAHQGAFIVLAALRKRARMS